MLIIDMVQKKKKTNQVLATLNDIIWSIREYE